MISDEELAAMHAHDEEVQRQFAELGTERDSARREVETLSRDIQIARNERGLAEAARDSAQEREQHALADAQTAWRQTAVAEAAMTELAQERDQAVLDLSTVRAVLAERDNQIELMRSEVVMLDALRSAGVDNWAGYELAQEIANRG